MVYFHSLIVMPVHVAKVLIETFQPNQNNVMHVKGIIKLYITSI